MDGDPDGDGKADVYALESEAVLAHQKAYVRQVIETVNEFDHVLYEIINEVENSQRGFQWQVHMADFVREVERDMPKQHPVGITAEGGGQFNPVVFCHATPTGSRRATGRTASIAMTRPRRTATR